MEIEPFAANNVSTLFSEHILYGLYAHLANSYSCDYIKTTAPTVKLQFIMRYDNS